MLRKTIHRFVPPAVAVACAVGSLTAAAEPLTITTIAQPAAQLQADQAALQRAAGRLQADLATLQADRASGKMTAVSADQLAVYWTKQAIIGGAQAVAADQAIKNPLQQQADVATLKRAVRRLDKDLATLRADTEEGKMAAASKDAEIVYKDRMAYVGERKAIVHDRLALQAARM